MRINYDGMCCDVPLADVQQGNCVVFEHVFHQKHAPGDIFIVGRIPRQYLSDRERCNDAIPVTNLRTGEMSMVRGDRCVARVSATVVLNRCA